MIVEPFSLPGLRRVRTKVVAPVLAFFFLIPGFDSYKLCDLGQATSPVWTSVPSPVMWARQATCPTVHEKGRGPTSQLPHLGAGPDKRQSAGPRTLCCFGWWGVFLSWMILKDSWKALVLCLQQLPDKATSAEGLRGSGSSWRGARRTEVLKTEQEAWARGTGRATPGRLPGPATPGRPASHRLLSQPFLRSPENRILFSPCSSSLASAWRWPPQPLRQEFPSWLQGLTQTTVQGWEEKLQEL